jgi:hypothetical protein
MNLNGRQAMKQHRREITVALTTSYDEVSNRPEKEKRRNLERRKNDMKISKICPTLQHRSVRVRQYTSNRHILQETITYCV